ncbi:hypothetical protein [Nocardioides aurantiacus]|uniref:Uncharacterized protein n=1 Tax=Nocardioides aurantiacus TaxID=86796 RepID=A0A3N2CY24_9ACTN|nr:hypothetical protein [Nocardioides aurantiacus]ROR92328.1 hypothetical protein EDD33_3217 [Nocardioides aurantiacus]
MSASPHHHDGSTPLDPAAEDVAPSGARALDDATRLLREQPPHPRAVEIADRVLQRSLRTPRPAELVRGRGAMSFLRVSSLVLVERLREHVDAHLDGGAVGRVLLDVERGGRLDAVTIELLVRYGSDILTLGDRTRRLAAEALAETLGAPADGTELVTMAVSHVHVSDVTVGDPHLVDPSDE